MMNIQFMICPCCGEEDECYEWRTGNWVCDQCLNEQEEDEEEDHEIE